MTEKKASTIKEVIDLLNSKEYPYQIQYYTKFISSDDYVGNEAKLRIVKIRSLLASITISDTWKPEKKEVLAKRLSEWTESAAWSQIEHYNSDNFTEGYRFYLKEEIRSNEF